MRLQVNEEVNTVIQDKAGRIVATCWRSPKKKKTIAKEFVLRWNAFEDGGIVEDVCNQLMDLYDSCSYATSPEIYGTILGLHEKLEAALAKS